MNDYILLMHNDTTSRESDAAWERYLATLHASGQFEGGSSIAQGGACVNNTRAAPGVTAHLAGFIRVRAANLEAAKALLAGNPVLEAGGTVEIRELPRS